MRRRPVSDQSHERITRLRPSAQSPHAPDRLLLTASYTTRRFTLLQPVTYNFCCSVIRVWRTFIWKQVTVSDRHAMDATAPKMGGLDFLIPLIPLSITCYLFKKNSRTRFDLNRWDKQWSYITGVWRGGLKMTWWHQSKKSAQIMVFRSIYIKLYISCKCKL